MIKRLQAWGSTYLEATLSSGVDSPKTYLNLTQSLCNKFYNSMNFENLPVNFTTTIFIQHFIYLRWLIDTRKNDNHLVKAVHAKRIQYGFVNKFISKLLPCSVIVSALSYQLMPESKLLVCSATLSPHLL